MIFYALMTGGRPSVVRATIMAVIFLGSFLVERETDAFNTLALAAFVILLVNPLNLFDVGFQLSFISVFSIIYFYPVFMAAAEKIPGMKKGNPLARRLVQSLLVTVAVCLGVAGLIAYYFRIVTPVTVIANMIVIPMITVIIALGLALVIAGSVSAGLAVPAAMCLKFMLNLMVICVFGLVRIPGAYILLKDVSPAAVGAYYLAIIAAGGLTARLRRKAETAEPL